MNRNLAQLLMQLRFAPQKLRQKQLDAAEKLLVEVDENKEYPFEFVCYRITGYHPRNLPAQPLIRGGELAEDLRIFVSKLSGRLAQSASEQQQKVYTIEELAATLGVSMKTIDRWRKRGLLARKYVFEDGKKRIGLLQSAVDRFLEKKPHVITRAKGFARLSHKEKQKIIRRAAAHGAKGTMSRHQVIEQIAKEVGRAHETVRYTIINYERTNPDKPIFSRPAGVVSPAQAAELFRLYKQGCSIRELMHRYNRSKSSIYRIINQRRAKALRAREIEFIASDEFLEHGAEKKIRAGPIVDNPEISEQRSELPELGVESLLPEYLRKLKDAPVLDRDRELALFRRYNYLKYVACTTRVGMNPARVSGTHLKRIENYLAEAERIKQLLIEANLRLVVSVAIKHAGTGAQLSDLVSEGHVSLMRAVEKFDYTRGFRFSTHASWAITKDYARKIPAEAARPSKARADSLATVHRDLRTAAAADVGAIERARQSLTQVIKDDLNDREQHIILNHFGLVGTGVKKKKKTLKQIGDDLGLSKERVRQIELVGLQKLRQSLSPEQFELLTG
ncbi:MAG: DUF3853 family protein [Planctomycetota bacterium]|jgi:RNA polymerase sigma factor (sigma-70 family)